MEDHRAALPPPSDPWLRTAACSRQARLATLATEEDAGCTSPTPSCARPPLPNDAPSPTARRSSAGSWSPSTAILSEGEEEGFRSGVGPSLLPAILAPNSPGRRPIPLPCFLSVSHARDASEHGESDALLSQLRSRREVATSYSSCGNQVDAGHDANGADEEEEGQSTSSRQQHKEGVEMESEPGNEPENENGNDNGNENDTDDEAEPGFGFEPSSDLPASEQAPLMLNLDRFKCPPNPRIVHPARDRSRLSHQHEQKRRSAPTSSSKNSSRKRATTNTGALAKPSKAPATGAAPQPATPLSAGHVADYSSNTLANQLREIGAMPSNHPAEEAGVAVSAETNRFENARCGKQGTNTNLPPASHGHKRAREQAKAERLSRKRQAILCGPIRRVGAILPDQASELDLSAIEGKSLQALPSCPFCMRSFAPGARRRKHLSICAVSCPSGPLSVDMAWQIIATELSRLDQVAHAAAHKAFAERTVYEQVVTPAMVATAPKIKSTKLRNLISSRIAKRKDRAAGSSGSPKLSVQRSKLDSEYPASTSHQHVPTHTLDQVHVQANLGAEAKLPPPGVGKDASTGPTGSVRPLCLPDGATPTSSSFPFTLYCGQMTRLRPPRHARQEAPRTMRKIFASRTLNDRVDDIPVLKDATHARSSRASTDARVPSDFREPSCRSPHQCELTSPYSDARLSIRLDSKPLATHALPSCTAPKPPNFAGRMRVTDMYDWMHVDLPPLTRLRVLSLSSPGAWDPPIDLVDPADAPSASPFVSYYWHNRSSPSYQNQNRYQGQGQDQDQDQDQDQCQCQGQGQGQGQDRGQDCDQDMSVHKSRNQIVRPILLPPATTRLARLSYHQVLSTCCASHRTASSPCKLGLGVGACAPPQPRHGHPRLEILRPDASLSNSHGAPFLSGGGSTSLLSPSHEHGAHHNRQAAHVRSARLSQSGDLTGFPLACPAPLSALGSSSGGHLHRPSHSTLQTHSDPGRDASHASGLHIERVEQKEPSLTDTGPSPASCDHPSTGPSTPNAAVHNASAPCRFCAPDQSWAMLPAVSGALAQIAPHTTGQDAAPLPAVATFLSPDQKHLGKPAPSDDDLLRSHDSDAIRSPVFLSGAARDTSPEAVHDAWRLSVREAAILAPRTP